MAKGFTLSNGRSFATQGEGLAHFKEMLARHDDGEVVLNADDHADLVALLERYDHVNEGPSKIGTGVVRFERRKTFSKGFPTFGFWVVRRDGTDTDFSYKNAVTGRPKSHSQEFYDACHNAVMDDLRQEKARQFDKLADITGSLPCDITGAMITFKSGKLCHAYPSFGELVAEFKRSQGWDGGVPAGLLSPSADRQISTEFVDKVHSEQFRRFHHARATLRIVESSFASRAVVQSTTDVKRPILLTHYL